MGRPGSAGLMNSECEGLPRKTYKQRTGLKDIQGSLKNPQWSPRPTPPVANPILSIFLIYSMPPIHSYPFNLSYLLPAIQYFLSISIHSLFPIYFHPFNLSYLFPSVQSFRSGWLVSSRDDRHCPPSFFQLGPGTTFAREQ